MRRDRESSQSPSLSRTYPARQIPRAPIAQYDRLLACSAFFGWSEDPLP